MGGVMWPYYKSFCDIYDIPENYCSVMNASSATDLEEDDSEDEEEENDDDDEATVDNPGAFSLLPLKVLISLLKYLICFFLPGSKLWPRDVVLLLMSLYKPMRPLLEGGSHLRHNILYGQIAQGLLIKGHKRSWKQCKSKIARLRSKFVTEYQKTTKTGNSPSTWPFFSRMSDNMAGSASVRAPGLLSAGRGLQFRVDGEDQEGNRSGTRSRPTHKTKSKEPKPKKATYKNWRLEAHETNVRQRDDLVKQVDRMNDTLEKSAQRRDEFYTAYMNKYLK